jgi:hypothetical protein
MRSRKKKFVSSLDMALLGIEPSVAAANGAPDEEEDEADVLSGSLRRAPPALGPRKASAGGGLLGRIGAAALSSAK